MSDQQKNEQGPGVREQEIRAALDQHWAASDADDFETAAIRICDLISKGDKRIGKKTKKGASL